MVLLQVLRHPYIVSYEDFVRKDLTLGIVMELCEEGDLDAALRERRKTHCGRSLPGPTTFSRSRSTRTFFNSCWNAASTSRIWRGKSEKCERA